MRRIIYVPTLQQAKQLAPWACSFAPVPGGFMCFESATDFASYRRGT